MPARGGGGGGYPLHSQASCCILPHEVEWSLHRLVSGRDDPLHRGRPAVPVKRITTVMHYLSEAETVGGTETATWAGGLDRAFHDDGRQRLRGRGVKTTIFPLSLRPRFSFDGDYVRRLIAEDPETERHFTDYFGDLLYLKLRSRLRSPAQVEDARQETFVRVLTALKKKASLATPESLGAFVNAVCNNVLLETYRSAGRTTAAGRPAGRARGQPARRRVARVEVRGTRQGARGDCGDCRRETGT